MKTVCKKLLCLMLVAMLLVSAVPAAFAVEAITPPSAGVVEPETPDVVEPEEEESEAPKTTRYTVNVGNWEIDALAATNVASYELTEEQLNDLLSDKVSAAKELLYGTAYAADAKEGNVRSIYKDTNGTVITVWLNKVSVSGGSTGGNTGSGSTAKEKFEVRIVYGYTADRVHTVTDGTKYYDVIGGDPDRAGYEFNGWYSEALDDYIDKNDRVRSDDTITADWGNGPLSYSLSFDVDRDDVEQVNLLKKVTYGQPIGKLPVPETDDYVFLGWKVNGKMIDKDTIYELQGDAVAYAVWALESDKDGRPIIGNGGAIIDGEVQGKGKVYLEIYLNGDTDDREFRFDITDYADDYKITRDEVKKVISKKTSIKAKSGYELAYDGLFDEESWWWYCRDEETDGEGTITVNRDGNEYIYVMIRNVKKAVADSSNPKTGDNIMVAGATMTLAGAALISLIELKKRKMI